MKIPSSHECCRREIEDASWFAIVAGAAEPLAFVGMGAEGIVFSGREGHAWKVARWPDKSLEAEHDYLARASAEPTLARNVARPFHLRRVERDVLERELVGDSKRSLPLNVDAALETYQRIARVMRAAGWAGVEAKRDSFVYSPGRGAVLVDAGFAHRIGWTLARYAEDVLRGKRKLPKNEKPRDIAWCLRMDDDLLPAHVIARLNLAIEARWPGSVDAAEIIEQRKLLAKR